ncbi:hypothetical protein JMJ55_24185 [Belnapia sp. T6]|uniref:Transporter n=1 Tax=Belnapia mucosa TaxID=2804532 RepID=A0ABS1V9S7_9PROT|nr:hypothetical protein [Belnapia mucosa]MBL6458441.1 hypothetical protein [Belnapia mucosa]
MLHRLLTALARAAMLLLLAMVRSAVAQDEPIELADDPFEITDPIAAPPGATEVAFVGSYERARRGRVRDTGVAETELEMGVVPGLEFRLGQTGAYGNLETRRKLGTVTDLSGDPEEAGRGSWGGATRLGAMYQLSDGQGAFPAVGLLGRVRTLYGPGRPGYETEAVALIGKTFRGGERPLGIHVNLGWAARLNPQPGERPNRFLINASVGQAVSRDTALVVTYAREQQERGDRDYSVVQAGIRHRLQGGTVLGLAAGVGTNRDSPSFQIAFAVQWQLSEGGR